MREHYVHVPFPELSTDFLKEGDVIVKNYDKRSNSQIVEIALLTYEIAQKIGIKSAVEFNADYLPYDDSNDNTIFEAPLCSSLMGRQIQFMRGWKKFSSCIKGFNALGLMSEQVLDTHSQIEKLNGHEIISLKKEYLLSRDKSDGKGKIFSREELDSINDAKFSAVDNLDLALWKTFGNRTIVCSTSSNMGISLHEALRYMQQTKLNFEGISYNLLNINEGGLIIWCPDDSADFMNHEKTAFLKGLEAEQPPLTKLRTYINRIQRDPGALRDALLLGGYFFPTNPQSKDEIQNLLFFALTEVANERNVSISDLLLDEKVQFTLRSLRCEISKGKVYVTDGVEGGISGLMVPYLLMLEELIPNNKVKAIATWNQASIGAALAAAIIADNIIRNPNNLSERTRSKLNSLFPNLSRFLDSRVLGRDIKTRVHGVFDLANIQSIAQLLGVVVERHLSGRGTAYVGLGSSSYSNGNRCYEVLKESFENDLSFRGKSTFHPATHTLNPFAQALIYGEDVSRCIRNPRFKEISSISEKVTFIKEHTKKPESAGAAAMAGYLLSRLDAGTLSIIELSYTLKLLGFTQQRFLKFANYSPDSNGFSLFLQEASEEGVYMNSLAKNILLFLDWPIVELEKKARVEGMHSVLKNRLYPLNEPEFDILNPKINIYLTGDNTFQPDEELINQLLESQLKNSELITMSVENYKNSILKSNPRDIMNFTTKMFTGFSSALNSLNKRVMQMRINSLNRLVNNKVKSIMQSTND